MNMLFRISGIEGPHTTKRTNYVSSRNPRNKLSSSSNTLICPLRFGQGVFRTFSGVILSIEYLKISD